jgi:hypothetical protein
MKNTITDLNGHLFAQLERLGDEQLKGDELEIELKKARAISQLSENLIESFNLTLEAMKLADRNGIDLTRMNTNGLLPGPRKPGDI